MSWLIIDFIILWTAIFFRSVILFVAGCVIFGAAAADIIIFIFSYNCVEICDIKMRKYAPENEKVIITVCVNNSSILPFIDSSFRLTAENRLHGIKKKSINKVFIKPRTMGQKFEVSFKCSGYGRVDITADKLKIKDIMGIVCLKKRKKVSFSHTCIPNIADADYSAMPVNTDSFILSDEYSSIRELNENESIRNVNWKLTAAKNKLLTKEFEKISKDTVPIFMEFNDISVPVKLFSYCKRLAGEDKTSEIMYFSDGKYKTYKVENFENLVYFISLISLEKPYKDEKGRKFTNRVYIGRE